MAPFSSIWKSITWLKARPGVEIISRDRASSYADAARRGAPQAIQVSDRFHLLVNLHTALIRLFERKHDLLKRLAAEEHACLASRAEAPSTDLSATLAEPKPLPRKEVQRQARRDKREHRYEEVLKLHEQGISQVAIATLLGLHRDTVRRYLTAPAFPERIRSICCVSVSFIDLGERISKSAHEPLDKILLANPQ